MKVKVKIRFRAHIFWRLCVDIYYKLDNQFIYSCISRNYIYDIFSKKTAEDIFKGEVDIEMLKKEVKEYLIDIIKSDEESKIKNKNIKDLTKKEIKFEFDIREE